MLLHRATLIAAFSHITIIVFPYWDNSTYTPNTDICSKSLNHVILSWRLRLTISLFHTYLKTHDFSLRNITFISPLSTIIVKLYEIYLKLSRWHHSSQMASENEIIKLWHIQIISHCISYHINPHVRTSRKIDITYYFMFWLCENNFPRIRYLFNPTINNKRFI